jgi:hypothetical protein
MVNKINQKLSDSSSVTRLEVFSQRIYKFIKLKTKEELHAQVNAGKSQFIVD